MATQLQLAPSRLDFSQDVFEILNQTGRGEFEELLSGDKGGKHVRWIFRKVCIKTTLSLQ